MERRRLFSTSSSSAVKGTRRKLFSSPTVVAICQDCGEEIKTGDATTTETCPRCGSRRFNIPTKVQDLSQSDKDLKPKRIRKRLFSGSSNPGDDRYFSELKADDTTVEGYLKMYSGKELSPGQVEKIFSGMDLEREGLATVLENGNYKLFSMADEIQRLYSTLKITVIKELELTPQELPIPEIIEKIKESHPEIPTKGIVLIKKAHSLPKENLFSEKEEWIRDSGLKGDLEIEFNGKDFTEDELKAMLEDRYEDAPEGIIECLKESGIVEETPDGILHIKK